MLYSFAQKIYDKKGMNITAIDVRGVSSLTNYLLIADGSVDRHVIALGNAVLEEAKDLGMQVFHIDGEQEGDWVVVDLGEMMVHLFIPEMREKYRLEQVWHQGKLVEIPLKTEEMK